MISRRAFVSGRVQGVFFRASTAGMARQLGIRGHALNLDDGRVEVLAVGREDAVEKLLSWLRHGPPQARVDDVQVEEVPLPGDPPSGFTAG
ncbi:MAG: acylphosphatase [Gammaproteobacteria bacterium]